MNTPLVSVIMPAFNAEKFISEAIQSVLDQEYANFELLVINDGSTDKTKSVILGFDDPRIRYFEKENKGVSAARNVGLDHMKGEFFCFLDADDVMTRQGISARLEVFDRSPAIGFVDGKVEKWNADFSKKLGEWSPRFTGPPLLDLIQLTGHSFFGPTWMVKVDKSKTYQMMEGLTHAEDLLFYMNLARHKSEKSYGFTHNVILKYRVSKESAMSNLRGLETGYFTILQEIRKWPKIPEEVVKTFNSKARSIMWKSYLAKGQLIQSIRTILG